MKDVVRQISVVVSILATIIVNGLANALPINGLNTGEISDRFNVYFVPAGYVFSIWGLIYLGLIAFAIFQALPAQRDNPRLRATGWWIVLGGLANIAWILLWHYEIFPLTILVMLVLLASLITVYMHLGIGRSSVSNAETWLVRVPFSIYLGWITVATVANATSLLDYLKWNAFGIAPETWMVIILAAVLVISALMSFTRRDVAYTLGHPVGIGRYRPINTLHVAAVATPTWITFGLVALALVMAYVFKRK